jgi:hypothetical protein
MAIAMEAQAIPKRKYPSSVPCSGPRTADPFIPINMKLARANRFFTILYLRVRQPVCPIHHTQNVRSGVHRLAPVMNLGPQPEDIQRALRRD